MAFRCFTTVAVAASLLLLLSCSKTEDTAPERRIFGNPPTIESVNVSVNRRTAECSEYTQIWQALLCIDGFPPTLYSLWPGPEVTTRVTFSEVLFEVRVSDPESTPTQSDILLVTASYVKPGSSPEENSIVLFDDGSVNEFPLIQDGTNNETCSIESDQTCTSFGAQNCTIDQTGDPCCTADKATFPLTSGDDVEGNGVYKRRFAFVTNTGLNVLQNTPPIINNCVARATGEAPFMPGSLLGGVTEFKVEAVDRSGNIATWAQTPQVTIEPTEYECLGDDCFCCFFQAGDVFGECADLDGFIGAPGMGFDDGYCKLF